MAFNSQVLLLWCIIIFLQNIPSSIYAANSIYDLSSAKPRNPESLTTFSQRRSVSLLTSNQTSLVELEDGPNVCTKSTIQKQAVQVTKEVDCSFLDHVIDFFKSKKVCKKTKIVTEFRDVEVDVRVCCEGYQKFLTKCIPICPDQCVHGVCVAPNVCKCNPGYSGKRCLYACKNFTWGPDCSKPCHCVNAISCDPENGICNCKSGWQGTQCTEACPSTHWGPNCSLACDCDDNVGGDTQQSQIYQSHHPDDLTSHDMNAINLNANAQLTLAQHSIIAELLLLKNQNEKQKNTSPTTKTMLPIMTCDRFTGKCATTLSHLLATKLSTAEHCQLCFAFGHTSACSRTIETNDGVDTDKGDLLSTATRIITSSKVKCVCHVGYRGELCHEKCPLGTYGPNCGNQCDIQCPQKLKNLHFKTTNSSTHTAVSISNSGINLLFEGTLCHHETGKCTCPPGKTGKFCEIGCEYGRWGSDCLEVCRCQDLQSVIHRGGHMNGLGGRRKNILLSGGLNKCDPVTGHCICADGFSGQFCETSVCPPSKFGKNNCENECPTICPVIKPFADLNSNNDNNMNKSEAVRMCNPISGECMCPEGWTGPPQCDMRCPLEALTLYHPSETGLKVQHSAEFVTTVTNAPKKPQTQLHYYRTSSGPNCGLQCRCGPSYLHNPETRPHYVTKYNINSSVTNNFTALMLDYTRFKHWFWNRNKRSRIMPIIFECTVEDGRCVCPPGFTGPYCERLCPVGTFGPTCIHKCNCTTNELETDCHPVTGECQIGVNQISQTACNQANQGQKCVENLPISSSICKDGFWGLDCTNKCDMDCIKAANNVGCDKITGKCVCRPGFYGKKCHQICRVGWYGQDCVFKCPTRVPTPNITASNSCSSLYGYLDVRLLSPLPCHPLHGGICVCDYQRLLKDKIDNFSPANNDGAVRNYKLRNDELDFSDLDGQNNELVCGDTLLYDTQENAFHLIAQEISLSSGSSLSPRFRATRIIILGVGIGLVLLLIIAVSFFCLVVKRRHTSSLLLLQKNGKNYYETHRKKDPAAYYEMEENMYGLPKSPLGVVPLQEPQFSREPSILLTSPNCEDYVDQERTPIKMGGDKNFITKNHSSAQDKLNNDFDNPNYGGKTPMGTMMHLNNSHYSMIVPNPVNKTSKLGLKITKNNNLSNNQRNVASSSNLLNNYNYDDEASNSNIEDTKNFGLTLNRINNNVKLSNLETAAKIEAKENSKKRKNIDSPQQIFHQDENTIESNDDGPVTSSTLKTTFQNQNDSILHESLPQKNVKNMASNESNNRFEKSRQNENFQSSSNNFADADKDPFLLAFTPPSKENTNNDSRNNNDDNPKI